MNLSSSCRWREVFLSVLVFGLVVFLYLLGYIFYCGDGAAERLPCVVRGSFTECKEARETVMHIPDGYLSPKTCGVLFAAMVPVWYLALRRVERTLDVERLPFLAFSAAFVFVMMMFNFPLPGGTTGHVAGGALAAIVLGPWAGVVAMSLALFLQAVLFGDGGVTAFGANSFNMAFVMSFTGYYVYRTLHRGRDGTRWLWAASFAAGYVSVNLAALAAAIELGLQPSIAQSTTGAPLYAPYPLSVTVPAVLVPHLLFFGPVEGVATALVVSFLARTNADLLYRPAEAAPRPMWAVVVVMALLTPLGLLASGTAWGEWSVDELQLITGFIPEGMARLGGWWDGLMPGYTVSGMGPSLSYIVSAFIGSAAVVAGIYLVGKVWHR